MAVHMQEVLAQYVAPILAQYAHNTIGLDHAHTNKAIEKSIPAVLAGVIGHVNDEHAAKRFFNLLTGTNVDTRWLTPENVQGGTLERVLQLGQQWMGLLFGTQANEVEQAVAQDAGIETSQAGQILALAIPTVLAALKQWIQTNQYGQHQFYGQLVAQEPFFSKIFSPKLLAAVGVPSALALVAGVRSWGGQYFTEQADAVVAESTPLRTTPPPVAPVATDKAGMAWAKWVLALIVIGVLAWLAKSVFLSNGTPAAPAAASAPVVSAPVASSTPAIASSPAVASGASEPVVSSGVGSASDASAAVVAVDKVVFENGALKFYFATGSAKISPDAVDVAAQMLAAAKEGKKLRISGYNDATGDAESNQWLAKKRAQAVRTFLRKQGVPTAQIELVKPESNTSNSGSMAEDRRVEVTISE